MRNTGQKYYILCGKPVNDDNRFIYLLSASATEPDYSLWLVEFIDDNSFDIWPYEGTDTDKLIFELNEKFLETVFDDD